MSRVKRSEAGVTFVELIITVVIMSMIIGALGTSFVTAFNSARPNSERVRMSNDAQLIASFLVRDAQAAGGIDPNTIAPYTSLSNFPTTPTPVPVPGVFLPPLNANIGSYCAAPSGAVVQFGWNDRASSTAIHGHIVIYSLSSNALVRTSCVDGGAPSTLTLGREIASAVAVTNANVGSCTAGPTATVTLCVTSTTPAHGPAYTYRLTASLRPDNNQTIPTNANASPVPLLTLGGAGCTSGTTGFDVGGTPVVTIYGQVTINTTDSPGCPAMYLHGSYDFASGAISVLNGGTCSGCGSYSNYTTPFGNPYSNTLDPLAAQCATAGNPTPSGGAFHPGATPLVFKNLFSAGNVFFDHGIYVFCNGLTAGHITTPAPNLPGVTFYIVNGGYTQAGNADTTINGLLYAPTSIVAISGNGHFSATSVVAGAFTVQGNDPVVTIGTAPAVNISITGPNSLPSWTVGVQYPTTTMAATGGGGIYSWSATGLPPNLSIDPVSGVISGTPNTAGVYNPQVTVTDSLGDNATKSYAVTINGPLAISGPATLTDWTINRDYPGTAIIASGGTTPYQWTASGLPPGLSINVNTGVVSSTSGTGPTATGTFNATITLTDNTLTTATRSYTIKINPAPLITGPATLPNWTAGQVGYPNQTMTKSNGTAPFTWAASGLPTGQVINAGTGVISGTPTTAGTFSVSVTLTDKAGASNTRNYSVTINPAPGIATASLPNAEVGKAYNFTLTPTAGGTPPYTWSLVAPPAWLSINANTGTLTGTPPATGAPNVTVKVTDSTGASATKVYTLTIAAAVTISGPASLPNWTLNRDYPGTAIIVAGGVAPFTWTSTPLPAGLLLNAGTGVITGTPSATGTFTFTVTVSDAYGVTDPQLYTIVIHPVPSITTSSLPGGVQTFAYSTTVAATDGTPAYSWAASGLPAGLSMASGTGVISGTPSATGTFSVTITATDIAGASASSTLSLTINPPPTNNLSLGGQSGGGSFLAGTRIYYHGAVAGSFTITDDLTNSGGTPVSANFPTLTGTATGFTHVGGLVSTPAGGPFVSSTFSWSAGTSSSPTEVVTGTDSLGGTVVTTLTFVNDSTAPAPTVATVGNGGYTNLTTPAISGTAGSQAADATHSADNANVTVKIYSGPNTSGTLLQTIAAGVSGGAWTVSESALAANAQYTVQVTQSDAVGNLGTSATKTFVVDTVVPTVTASMSNGGGGSKVTVSGTAGAQAADATHSADGSTVAVFVCTQANYTSHGNVCNASSNPSFTNLAVNVAGSAYSVTTNNIGSGTYMATVTQSDAAGNVGSATTGPFVR